jgi:DUF1680 family protein
MKSPAFLNEMKYRALEAMPRISQELGKSAEQSGPILFGQLKDQFEAYLPVLKDKLLAQHTQLMEQAVATTKSQFNGLIQSELDEVMSKLQTGSGKNLTPEQLDALQKDMTEKISGTMDTLITKNI